MFAWILCNDRLANGLLMDCFIYMYCQLLRIFFLILKLDVIQYVQFLRYWIDFSDVGMLGYIFAAPSTRSLNSELLYFLVSTRRLGACTSVCSSLRRLPPTSMLFTVSQCTLCYCVVWFVGTMLAERTTLPSNGSNRGARQNSIYLNQTERAADYPGETSAPLITFPCILWSQLVANFHLWI